MVARRRHGGSGGVGAQEKTVFSHRLKAMSLPRTAATAMHHSANSLPAMKWGSAQAKVLLRNSNGSWEDRVQNVLCLFRASERHRVFMCGYKELNASWCFYIQFYHQCCPVKELLLSASPFLCSDGVFVKNFFGFRLSISQKKKTKLYSWQQWVI